MFDPAAVVRSLEGDPTELDRDALRELLQQSGRLRSWQDAREMRAIRALDALPPDPADPAKDTADRLARDQNVGSGEANRRTKTAAQLDELPATQAALEDGEITTGHADAIAQARGKADAQARAALDAAEAELLAQGAGEPPHEFRKRVDDFIKRHTADDGRSDWERKKANQRLSLFKDRDGMTGVRGGFAPEEGQIARSTLEGIAEELFRRDHRDHPDDEPVPFAERTNEQRLAEAFIEACRRAGKADGPATDNGRAVVILQYEDLLDRLDRLGISSTLADGTPVPASIARRMACEYGLTPVVLGGESIPLDAGRSKRIATPTQRRALQSVWSTCSFADCRAPFEWCQIHHVVDFGLDGPTNLGNLTPVCRHCHDLAHTAGWRLTKAADGAVTTTAPDGQVWVRRPDRRRRAGPPRAAASGTSTSATLFSPAA